MRDSVSSADAQADAAPAARTMGPACPLWGIVPTDDPTEEAAAEFGRILSGQSREPVVLSGDMSRPLAELPFSEGMAVPLWDACEPETVASLHRLYRDAGASAAVTNTMGCTATAISAAGLDVPVREANVRAARAAYTSGSRFVVGCIGPCGLDLEAVATDAPAMVEARAAYREQAQRLKWCDVHAFLVRDMTSVADALAAVESIRLVCDRPIVCCLAPAKKNHLSDGSRIPEAFAALAAAGANCLGVSVPLPCASELAEQVVGTAADLGCGAAFVLSVPDGMGEREASRFFSAAGEDLRAMGACVLGCGPGASVRQTASLSDGVLAADDRR